MVIMMMMIVMMMVIMMMMIVMMMVTMTHSVQPSKVATVKRVSIPFLTSSKLRLLLLHWRSCTTTFVSSMPLKKMKWPLC